ncbi:MAG: RNA polymerase sigma factor [Acidimicrobiales bacterium]
MERAGAPAVPNPVVAAVDDPTVSDRGAFDLTEPAGRAHQPAAQPAEAPCPRVRPPVPVRKATSGRQRHPDEVAGADWLRRAILTLPLLQRQVVVLRDLEDRSESEVAAILGVPLGTVKSRLSRASSALRATTREGGDHGTTGAAPDVPTAAKRRRKSALGGGWHEAP